MFSLGGQNSLGGRDCIDGISKPGQNAHKGLIKTKLHSLKNHFSSGVKLTEPELSLDIDILIKNPLLNSNQAIELFGLLVKNLDNRAATPSTEVQVNNVLDKIGELSRLSPSILKKLAKVKLPPNATDSIIEKYVAILSESYKSDAFTTHQFSLSKLINTANSGLLKSKKDIIVDRLTEMSVQSSPVPQRVVDDLPSFGPDILKAFVQKNHNFISQNRASNTGGVLSTMVVGIATVFGGAHTLTLPQAVAEEMDGVTLSVFKTNMQNHKWGTGTVFMPIVLPEQGVIDSLKSTASKQLTKDKVDFYTYVNEYFSHQEPSNPTKGHFQRRVNHLVDFYKHIHSKTQKSYGEIFKMPLNVLLEKLDVEPERFKDNPTLLADIVNFQCKSFMEEGMHDALGSKRPLDSILEKIEELKPGFKDNFNDIYSETEIPLKWGLIRGVQEAGPFMASAGIASAMGGPSALFNMVSIKFKMAAVLRAVKFGVDRLPHVSEEHKAQLLDVVRFAGQAISHSANANAKGFVGAGVAAITGRSAELIGRTLSDVVLRQIPGLNSTDRDALNDTFSAAISTSVLYNEGIQNGATARVEGAIDQARESIVGAADEMVTSLSESLSPQLSKLNLLDMSEQDSKKFMDSLRDGIYNAITYSSSAIIGVKAISGAHRLAHDPQAFADAVSRTRSTLAEAAKNSGEVLSTILSDSTFQKALTSVCIFHNLVVPVKALPIKNEILKDQLKQLCSKALFAEYDEGTGKCRATKDVKFGDIEISAYSEITLEHLRQIQTGLQGLLSREKRQLHTAFQGTSLYDCTTEMGHKIDNVDVYKALLFNMSDELKAAFLFTFAQESAANSYRAPFENCNDAIKMELTQHFEEFIHVDLGSPPTITVNDRVFVYESGGDISEFFGQADLIAELNNRIQPLVTTPTPSTPAPVATSFTLLNAFQKFVNRNQTVRFSGSMFNDNGVNISPATNITYSGGKVNTFELGFDQQLVGLFTPLIPGFDAAKVNGTNIYTFTRSAGNSHLYPLIEQLNFGGSTQVTIWNDVGLPLHEFNLHGPLPLAGQSETVPDFLNACNDQFEIININGTDIRKCMDLVNLPIGSSPNQMLQFNGTQVSLIESVNGDFTNNTIATILGDDVNKLAVRDGKLFHTKGHGHAALKGFNAINHNITGVNTPQKIEALSALLPPENQITISPDGLVSIEGGPQNIGSVATGDALNSITIDATEAAAGSARDARVTIGDQEIEGPLNYDGTSWTITNNRITYPVQLTTEQIRQISLVSRTFQTSPLAIVESLSFNNRTVTSSSQNLEGDGALVDISRYPDADQYAIARQLGYGSDADPSNVMTFFPGGDNTLRLSRGNGRIEFSATVAESLRSPHYFQEVLQNMGIGNQPFNLAQCSNGTINGGNVTAFCDTLTANGFQVNSTSLSFTLSDGIVGVTGLGEADTQELRQFVLEPSLRDSLQGIVDNFQDSGILQDGVRYVLSLITSPPDLTTTKTATTLAITAAESTQESTAESTAESTLEPTPGSGGSGIPGGSGEGSAGGQQGTSVERNAGVPVLPVALGGAALLIAAAGLWVTYNHNRGRGARGRSETSNNFANPAYNG